MVDVAHDGHDRGTNLENVLALSLKLCLEVDVEGLEQLALLVLGGHNLDDVAQLGTQQLEGVLVEGLSLGSHLAQVEEHRNQRGRVCANLLGEVHDGGAATQTNLGRAVAARNNHATGCRCVQLLLLMAASCLGLAALTLGAAATECTLCIAATAGAGTTRTAVEAAGTAAATCAAAAVTAAVVGTGRAATNVGNLGHHRGVRACAATSRTGCTGTCATCRAGTTVATGTCATCGAGTAIAAGACATVATGTTVTCRTGTAGTLGVATATLHTLLGCEGVVAGARTGLGAGLRSGRLGCCRLRCSLGACHALLGCEGVVTRAGAAGLGCCCRLCGGLSGCRLGSCALSCCGLSCRPGCRLSGRLCRCGLGSCRRLSGGLSRCRLGSRLSCRLCGSCCLCGRLSGCGGEFRAQLLQNHGVQGGRGALNELAHILELGDNFLGRYAYLFSKLVYSRLSQIFSIPGPHREWCGH